MTQTGEYTVAVALAILVIFIVVSIVIEVRASEAHYNNKHKKVKRHK